MGNETKSISINKTISLSFNEYALIQVNVYWILRKRLLQLNKYISSLGKNIRSTRKLSLIAKQNIFVRIIKHLILLNNNFKISSLRNH